MSWLNSFVHKFQTRFVWKLMVSYLVVIIVGVVTLAVAAESVTPTAFNRHMLGMQQMMMGGQMSRQQMGADLFTNFRAAVTEALLVSTIAALISAILVSVFVSRRVVTPIRQMMTASRHIAAGHYRERVKVVSDDELGQLAQSFNQMAAGLEQTEAMRRELIGNVAHELRTPLSTIKGYMEGLMDGVLPPEPTTYQQVYREADRLQRLVSDLQELSRVEAGAFELDCQPVNMAELIQHTATRLGPQFEEKGVQLNVDLPADLPRVQADEDRIDQILINLIGNALQYTPTGGTVTVMAEKRPLELWVTIRDTGIGIAAEHLTLLFTRFYRVDKSRSRAGGGSGIGLTITKHLVEAHGGRVWADSQGAGQGSVFGFALPVA
jgi:histidine kinase